MILQVVIGVAAAGRPVGTLTLRQTLVPTSERRPTEDDEGFDTNPEARTPCKNQNKSPDELAERQSRDR
jgi:hypothetical protein